MKSPICDMLGIDFPLLAFSHCRDVVAAVSRAGGFGVLGATSHSPESIEQELKWIDDHVDGKPYGLDVLIPENISTAGEKDVTWKSLEARISPQHRDFTRNLLKKYGIDDQRRRQPAAAVRRATRAGSSRCVVPAPDPPDRQCAGRAAKGDDRDGQKT
jgi:NAD(P)H-dependent flavin oxidoreductase YrpB (nitropropane dioxygenase family)